MPTAIEAKSKLDASRVVDELSRFVTSEDFAGFDPYDALNSPIARALSFGQKYGRIAWIQLFRRMPINLRPLMFSSKGHNPKALGLFLGGYAKLQSLNRCPEYENNIRRLTALLDSTKSLGYSGNCWGYNFDWQSRAFYVPKHTPTIVNSCFIGHALLDAYEHLGRDSFLESAIPIKDFLLNDLFRTKHGETFCFSYTPIDKTAVHNANMLGASLLIRLSKLIGDESLRDPALSSLAYSMNHQREDGSWFYAEAEIQQWVDSFHTGFNLEALRWFRKCGEGGQFQAAYEKGRNYYATTFFLEDGTPKYYQDKVYPLDIHAPTEAVSYFSGEGEDYSELTGKILNWILVNMKDPKGYFYFRKGKYTTNKIPYMRWSQAWAFRALTEYQINRISLK